MTTTLESPNSTPLALALRRIYLARFGFAVVWAILLALFAGLGAPVLTVLLVIYPLADAGAVLVELRECATSSRPSAVVNIVVSTLAAIALGWASLVSVAAVLVVWGVWAVLAGAAQLATALTRRGLGGRWPQILSGGLSVLVGFGFLFQGLQGASSAASVAGYAAFGGVLFLVSALRLGRSERRA